MERLNPASRRDRYGRRINRDHSPILLALVPWGSIMLMAMLPFLVVTASLPLMPPLALLFLLAWRLVRPGVLPVWAGLPLGLWVDLFSGQPFGCSVLLFSLTLLGIEVLESRFPWRDFWQDWAIAAVAIIAYVVLGAAFSGASVQPVGIPAIFPQIAMAILAYPAVARLTASLDVVRLWRVRSID